MNKYLIINYIFTILNLNIYIYIYIQLFNIGILSNPKLLQKTDPAIVTQINQKLQKLVEVFNINKIYYNY